VSSFSYDTRVFMEIVSHNDKDALVKMASQKLFSFFEKYRERQILFLSSGGSALSLLELAPDANLGVNITITVLDERFTHRSEIQNFSSLCQSAFYNKSIMHGAQAINPLLNMEDGLKISAHKFEKNVRKWIAQNPDGIIFATLGIGRDGHTAGIMPFPEDEDEFNILFESQNWFVGYTAKNKSELSKRMTASCTFLREKIDYAIAFVVGEEKRDAISKTLAKNGALKDTPARILHEMKKVELFTNCENNFV
jgi:6-phosphogluconolactonase/glucosamine-6-phosphate isomerase/deaminase